MLEGGEKEMALLNPARSLKVFSEGYITPYKSLL